MTELPNGDLQTENGKVIESKKRTRCEVYSRVVGYLRPASQWNKGKKEEWKDRKAYTPHIIEGAEPQDERDA